MRYRISLRIKVISGVVLLVGLITSSVYYLTAIRFHRMMEGAIAVQQSKLTEIIADIWEKGMPVTEIADLFKNDSSILKITFYPTDGREILFELGLSDTIHQQSQEFHHDFEDQHSLVREVGKAEGILHLTGHNLLHVAESKFGRVEVLINTKTFNVRIAELIRLGNWVIVLTIFLAGLSVFIIDYRLRQVVEKMISTAKEIASGKMIQQLDIRTGDALEELSDGFNNLAKNLSLREAEVQQAQNELNEIIAAQTSELRQERDRLSRILDNIPSAFILFDNNLRVIAVSSAVSELKQIIPHSIEGSSCSCSFNEDVEQECIIQRAFRETKAIIGRQRRTIIDGKDKIHEHSVFPVKEGENIVGWLETITDVTDQVHHQARLVNAERMSAVGEMAAVLAHEIRNRLTSVKLLLQIDTEAENLTKTQWDHLNQVVTSVNGMERMVEDLLRFARPSPVNKKPVKLVELIRMVRQRIEPFARESNIHLELLNLARDTSAELDAEKINQALINLLLNAIQSTDRDGTVRMAMFWSERSDDEEYLSLEVQIEDHQLKKMSSSNTKSFLFFTIDDTGHGVPVEMSMKIFEPFFTTKPRGTGIGLATVKQIAKDHGGYVSLDESPLKGARFVMAVQTERLN